MPVIPNAHPNATVLAIAEKAADLIAGRRSPGPRTSPGRTTRPPTEKDKQAMTAAAARNEQLRRYVENHHIDYIPAGARHGKPWHQFVFWFGRQRQRLQRRPRRGRRRASG